MPLSSCVRCKKIFNKTDSPVCVDCQPEEDGDRKKVEELVAQDSSLTVEQVSKLAEVEVAVVSRMMKEGAVATVAVGSVTCGRCGAPAISVTKRLCQSCLDKLNAEMLQAQSDIQASKDRVRRSGGNVRSEFDQKRRI